MSTADQRPVVGGCPVNRGQGTSRATAASPGAGANAPSAEETAPAETAPSATTAETAPATPGRFSTDHGYFGPGSVSWLLFSDPSSKLGGVAALLLQSLNPMMMRVFEGTSSYAEDIEGRGERTGRYIDTTVFGDRAHADAAAEAVRRLHAASVWTDPRTGEQLRADTEEWLAWTHNAIVYGVLRAADAFGPWLSVADQDRFVREQHEAARLVGIADEALLPDTRAELDRYIDDNKDWMALTIPAAELSRNLRSPVLSGNPVKVWMGLNIQDAILSLLPDWALLLFGIAGRPMNMRAASRVTRRFIAATRAGRTSDELITEVAKRVETHPYRRVRGGRR